MSGWIWWLIVAGAFAVGEATLTTGFWLAPMALGAGVAAAASAVGLSEGVDFAVFVVFTLTALVGLRPLVASRLVHSGPLLRTGAAALVGQDGVVVDRIANSEHAGLVRIGGEVWTARAYDEARVIPVGTTVHIVEIRGATALVIE